MLLPLSFWQEYVRLMHMNKFWQTNVYLPRRSQRWSQFQRNLGWRRHFSGNFEQTCRLISTTEYSYLVVRHDIWTKLETFGILMKICLRNFVDPVTRAHTNGIERCWRPLKEVLSQRKGYRIDHFDNILHCWLFEYNLQRRGLRMDQIYDEILEALT